MGLGFELDRLFLKLVVEFGQLNAPTLGFSMGRLFGSEPARLRLSLATGSEVAGDFSKSNQPPVAVAHSGNHHIGPEARTVFAHAPAFVLETPFARGHFQFMLWKPLGNCLRRVEQREGAAENLIGAISLDVLCTVVPACNIAFGVKHQNSVIL